MSLELAHVESGIVVAIHDGTELAALGRLADDLKCTPDASVVVDVSRMTMAPRSGVEQMMGQILSVARANTGQRWSLVATRLSARRLLRPLCAGAGIGVFPSVDSALANTIPLGVPDRAEVAAVANLFDRLRPSEENVDAAMVRLHASGFEVRFVLEPDDIPPGIFCPACSRRFLPERAEIVEAHRFEEPTSPDREDLLLALACPRCAARGTVLTGYGPAAIAEETEILLALALRTASVYPALLGTAAAAGG